MSKRRGLRVLLVAAASSTTGGGERHVADLVRLLSERGVELALACPGGGDLPGIAARAGAPWVPLEIASGFSLGQVRTLRTAIDTFAPDIVHAHGSRAALFARLADREAANRVVYTLHGIHLDKAGAPARRWALLRLERRLRGRAAAFITVCEADKRKGAELRILAEEKTTAVYNAVGAFEATEADGRAFRGEIGVEPGASLALSVGRFVEQKDQRTLLHAWRKVAEEQPGATLALVGSGPLAGMLRATAQDLGVSGSVRFVPARPDLRPAYAAADLFVLSSLWEGLPYVVLEAMAAGLPVVSTAVDGIPEAVVDGGSGVLVPAADPSALADTVLTLLRDPEKARRFGQAGRERVDRMFRYEAMTDGVLGVYAGVAANRQRCQRA